MRQIKFRCFRDGQMIQLDQMNTSRHENHDFQKSEDRGILMQFTGLPDKNGEEIYEGDRLKDSSGYIWVVYWYEDHACFGCYDESLPHIKHEIIDNLNFKVIGNIYETPELLSQ